MADEIRRLKRQLERQGWRIVEKKSGAFMALSPDGETKVTIHATPGDRRALKNAVANLRKGGFDPSA
jgi:hypothetical protein